ncbi:MAG: zinc-binding dehydrogenase, partial [Gammaproteobacteria bacterium]|nr:zinc-binding dehydrogenase [Gammaproteobacteria bacterium]
VAGFGFADLAVGSLHLTRPTLFHFVSDRGWLESASAALFDMIGSGRIRITVNQTYPLAEAGRAHEALEGRETTGCTLLLP